ncbi:MAG: polyprenyl synthetase family protein [Jatrophihabitans sp.]|uniref:polyprenyl synthetase family protein n=1 Tax=Jatrophihabitans sp. TaxID=1932789 RepID=UPI003F7F7E10
MTQVDHVLAEFLDRRADSLLEVGAELAPMVEAARSIVLDGGKRLRPQFAYWGWRSVRDDGEGVDPRIVRAAASLELLHACALVHDDVMDESDTRRGNPAAHVAFAAQHADAGWLGDPAAFGRAAAILLGDLLLSWADALLDEAGFAATRPVFDSMRQVVMAGQYLDVLVQARGDFSAADAMRVARFKTSKYTVEGPLHLGAAAAGATPATTAALSAYGLPLGEAFQLRDDVLGVFGDPSVTGKPAGDDLSEGKQTLLVALAMERATPAQQRTLRDGLGARALSDADVAGLRAVIEDTGALDEVEKLITERAEQARGALDTDAIRPEARDALDALATAAVERRA